MSAATRDALLHVGKLFLVVVGIGAVYSLALAAGHKAGPDSAFAILVPRAVSVRACLTEGWLTVLYQPLFWLSAAVVGVVYNALTGEIDPQQ